MPIEIQYTDDGGVIFSALGKVKGKDIIESEKKIFQDSRFTELRYWLVDRSRCSDYLVSSEEVREIAELDKAAAKINPDLLMVLISETDLQYGMSRMYGAYMNDEGFVTKIVRSKEEALKWLEAKLN